MGDLFPRSSGLLGRCTFPPAGSRIDCAVSGGADSLALLALAVEAGCRVTAWHVDHRLRPAGSAEAAVVAEVASRFGADFRGVTVEVGDGPNLEARAREARRSALPPGCATGHTADDQAETILINLLRGSGTDGLAGMRPGPAHPILGLRRHETHKLCAELGLHPVSDPSNDDRRFLRNAVRHDLVPMLDQMGQRDVGAVLARQAELLRDESDLLDELARPLATGEVAQLRQAPVALARRAIRLLLTPHLGGRPPSAAAVRRIMAVVAGEIRATEVVDGIRVSRRAGRLVISRE